MQRLTDRARTTERESQSQRDRQTETDRQRETERKTDTDRQTDRQTETALTSTEVEGLPGDAEVQVLLHRLHGVPQMGQLVLGVQAVVLVLLDGGRHHRHHRHQVLHRVVAVHLLVPAGVGYRQCYGLVWVTDGWLNGGVGYAAGLVTAVLL